MLWQASHNAIPTLCNLWRRDVVSSTICLGCKVGYEDAIHALWSCCSLFVVWKDDAMLMKLLQYEFRHFADLLGMVFTIKDCIDKNLLAMSFWLIWSSRNLARFDGYQVDFPRIRKAANSLLQYFLSA
ncbi:hypothetical protein SO802_006567 [Lithocarpus litseifolius]|uniref:Reverse transcriptase zinc-binding domain-containing protein n=1 Tax=Lithocarpus litseifolius TaxID=425828 RepID=A0AAW2DMX0_9ROSI